MVALSAWYTIVSAKVVYVPIGTKINKKGEPVTIFARTGIRINMADGSWWFNHFKYGTWSRHYPAMETVGERFNAKSVPVERKESYTPSKLQREYAGRGGLLVALVEGSVLALEEEAERKAAA